MVFHPFSPSPARTSTASYAATLAVFVVACSGTDVGYPRASAISTCVTGGESATGGTAANSGGTASGAGRSSGGALITGGNRAAGGSAGGPSVASGGASSAGAVSQGGMQSTGGLVSSGGQSAGGASGSTSAGATGNGGNAVGGGAAGGAPTTGFPWPGAYDAAAAPMPGDGHHNAGTSCMSSVCHGTKVPFVYGGTVYKADGVTGAANVQVGIFDGVSTLVTYSAQNGNIWLPSSAGAVTWANATIALRNKNGERIKPATAPREAACNGTGCHNSQKRLLEP